MELGLEFGMEMGKGTEWEIVVEGCEAIVLIHLMDFNERVECV